MKHSAFLSYVILVTLTANSFADPHANQAARSIFVEPSFPPLPVPTPCVPKAVSKSFSTVATTRCHPGKAGRIIALTFNDACTFFTYKVKLCRGTKVDMFARKVRMCLRAVIRRCSKGIFGKCGSAIREDCPYGKLLQLSAVA